MATIAVTNVNPRVKVPQLVKMLTKAIRGNFRVLDMKQEKNGKVCYVKLAPRVDPLQTCEDIKQKTNFRAYVPDKIPVISNPSKRTHISTKMKRLMMATPAQVFVRTHHEILEEMQSKYSGLFNLSKKTGHKLMDNIARTVFERLHQIMEKNPGALKTGFIMSQLYRRLHPHFGDFQLILSSLHKLQDGAGAPRGELSEPSLMAVSAQPAVFDNVPLDKLQSACEKYSAKIIKKIKEHISELNVEPSDSDTVEETARKRVQEQLYKMVPYLPQIVRQVISNHFIPDKAPFHRVRMYGEPFMPRKEVMAPVLRKYHAVHFMRSDRMFNMLRFNVPLRQFANLMSLDGTVVGGVKLVVRSSDIPLYVVTKELKKEMFGVFGETEDVEIPDIEEEAMEEEVNLDDGWITMSEG